MNTERKIAAGTACVAASIAVFTPQSAFTGGLLDIAPLEARTGAWASAAVLLLAAAVWPACRRVAWVVTSAIAAAHAVLVVLAALQSVSPLHVASGGLIYLGLLAISVSAPGISAERRLTKTDISGGKHGK